MTNRGPTPADARYRGIKLAVAATLVVFLVLGSAFKAGLEAIGFYPERLASSSFEKEVPSSFGEQSFTITDGDTIKMADGTRVRLVGFDTPETFERQCDREAVLGHRVSERLRELVASGRSAVTKVACSCNLETEGTEHCNYGRSCGILRIDG